MKLARKVVFIYIIAILIPTLTLATGLYQVSMNGIKQTYYESQRNIILSAKENLTLQMNQISAATNYYQESDTLLELLNGTYSDISNTLFYYIRDVNPLIKATKVNPYILNVRIFGFKGCALNMKSGLASIEYLEKSEDFIEQIYGKSDIWELTYQERNLDIHYYCSIYTPNYPYISGLLEFAVDTNAFANALNSQLSRPFFLAMQDGTFIGFENDLFIHYQEKPELLTNKDNYVYEISYQDGFPSILIPIFPLKNLAVQNSLIVISIITIAVILTVLYFLLTSSITNRLFALTLHIRKADVAKLEPFHKSIYKDEVGVVISSYNELVARTNNLIHENLMSQLQKKEAEYYALQSQIKPHFLYNILENIRMNAETNNDPDTADMLTALGKYMRYSLNRSTSPIHLEKELYSAKIFLQIHKIRMKEKMFYEIIITTEIDNILCPRFLLQPLIENCLLHGYRMDRQLLIRILLSDGAESGKPGYVQIKIEDNGNGIKKDLLKQMQKKLQLKEVETTHHIGLLNVNSRLAAFYDAKEGKIHMSSTEGQGTQMIFYLRKESNLHENTNS